MRTFTFKIALEVLNHLGRNLYSGFLPILGEAVSNSWDAEANNVYVTLNRDENYMLIKDDGCGMDENDLQDKFLQISYSRRDEENSHISAQKKRPYIGRKGIGKLALLSCSKQLHIMSRKNSDDDYASICIDNDRLDNEIKEKKTIDDHKLGSANIPEDLVRGHDKGTIIYFKDIYTKIRNKEGYIKQLMALYFRFSILDKKFSLYFNGEKVSVKDLSKLINQTQFFWKIGDSYDDDYMSELSQQQRIIQGKPIHSNIIKGFIASVQLPRDLKLWENEIVSIDVFVNGRVRQKDFGSEISKSSNYGRYLYGQIHCDSLDGDKVSDLFTSSRESIKDSDEKDKLTKELENILNQIGKEWNKLREEHNPDEGITKNIKLNNILSRYTGAWASKKAKSLKEEAEKNINSYAECYIAENLLRHYIDERTEVEEKEIEEKMVDPKKNYRKQEEDQKKKNNISIDIREQKFKKKGLAYLSAYDLAKLAEIKNNDLSKDIPAYNIVRNALATLPY